MTYSSDRLDRIEALLAAVTESNAASNQRLDRIAFTRAEINQSEVLEAAIALWVQQQEGK
jgi:hypothetical protein